MDSLEIAPLADAIYRDRVERARRETPGSKLLAGEELFHFACSMNADGIRRQHPDWSESQVLDEIKRRLALRKRLEGSHVGRLEIPYSIAQTFWMAERQRL